MNPFYNVYYSSATYYASVNQADLLLVAHTITERHKLNSLKIHLHLLMQYRRISSTAIKKHMNNVKMHINH